MANNDGEVRIGTKIDTSGVDKGLKDINNKLDKNTNSVKKNNLNIAKLTGALGGLTTGLKLGASAVEKFSEAYDKQAKAEITLASAVKNNPYMDNSAIQSLKNYASELQKMGTIGDEQIIPLMAELVSNGRTESEIMRIMSASLDASSSGAISFENAVKSLNMSLSGQIGTLGRVLPSLKNLTSEELENGKAIEKVAEAYKGLSQETAKATGSREQMKNARGDFEEALGTFTKPTSDLWNNFWKGYYERGVDRINALNKYLDNGLSKVYGQKTVDNFSAQLKKIRSDANKNAYLNDETMDMSTEQLNDAKIYLESLKKRSAEEEKILKYINREISGREDYQKLVDKWNAEDLKAQEEKTKALKTQAEIEKEATDHKTANQKALDETIKKIKLEAQIRGEEVDQMEIYNAMVESYIDLVTGSQYVTEDNDLARSRRKEIEDFAKTLPLLADATDSATESQRDWNAEISELLEKVFPQAEETADDIIQQLKDKTEELNKEIESGLEETSDAYKEYIDLREQLARGITELERQQAEERKQIIQDEITAQIEGASRMLSQVTELGNVISDQIQTQRNAELDVISKAYTDGLISYEDYCNKKKELNKKALQDEYNLRLAEWILSLSQATIDGAVATVKAYKDGGEAQALLVGLQTALQIATITASKPTPPRYKTGGYVDGGNYSDGKSVRVSSGELILNREQQAQLWQLANGNTRGGMSLNVDIVNNRGNDTQVSTQLTERGLRVTVDKLVKSSLGEGKYNGALAIAQDKAQGVNIL